MIGLTLYFRFFWTSFLQSVGLKGSKKHFFTSVLILGQETKKTCFFQKFCEFLKISSFFRLLPSIAKFKLKKVSFFSPFFSLAPSISYQSGKISFKIIEKVRTPKSSEQEILHNFILNELVPWSRGFFKSVKNDQKRQV